MGVYLYDPSHQYRGLEPGSEEYLKLRIFYLKKFLEAVKDDNIWMEKHYLQKILTGIKYNNYSENTVKKLESIFKKRAEWCSYYFLGFCESIVYGDDLTIAEKRDFLNKTNYTFKTCRNQQSDYWGNLKDDLHRLFDLYRKNGFASKKDIARFQECSRIYSCSSMEAEMRDTLHDLGYEDVEYEKTFPGLVGDNGGLLRFDGCITKDEQTILIECQGLQHYQAIEYFGGENQLCKQQYHDKLKKDFCIKNKIPLLLIRHDQSVRSTLKRFLTRKTYNNIVYEYK